MKKCVLIINPNSGKNMNKSYLYKYQKILADNGYEMKVYFTARSKHAIEIIQSISYADLVISLGGDGTFNEVVTGNIKRKNRLLLAHIPVGTTNDIGSMFGYGKNVIENLKLLMAGTEKEIDICTINKTPFVYVAGFGKFMNVPFDTPRNLKSKIGYLAYIYEGIKHFIIPTKLYEITFEIDGRKYNGNYSFMLISNANRVAGINNIHKNVKLDDNLFEVILCNLTKKTDVIKALYNMFTNNLDHVKGVECYRISELEIRFKQVPKNAWCIDGEKLDDNTDKYKIEIVKDFKIMMPKKNVEKLFVNKK